MHTPHTRSFRGSGKRLGSILVLACLGAGLSQVQEQAGRYTRSAVAADARGNAASVESDAMPALQALFCADTVRGDAQLSDVFFIDNRRGWAVGDRGTIWHTEDGGVHWSLQPSGVAAPLHAVWFVDAQTGWAAGGYARPNSGDSTGVVLHTTDGGRRWQQVSDLLLPRLRRLAFFDRSCGWALGDRSPLFTSGLLITKTAGRSWEALPSCLTGPWQAGDLASTGDGILAHCAGTTAMARGGQVAPSTTPGFAPRNVAALRLVRAVEPLSYGWLAGSGGLLMLTGDMGNSWQPPPGRLPPEALQVDFHALAVCGPRVWVAGSPGTRVLYSPDAGHSWQWFPTGQSLPIRALHFADESHGWAVGSLGTILTTNDGGQSWQRQRCGGTRAAVLGVFARADDVPLELFALLSGEKGYLGVLQIVARTAGADSNFASTFTAEAIHEAMLHVGACGAETAWQFPTPDRLIRPTESLVRQAWDEANDGHALEAMESLLVRWLRQWRPEVVLTHGGLQVGDPAARLVQQAVLRAVAQAAEPTAYAEQITRLGLQPWQVTRVLAVDNSTDGEGAIIGSSQLAENLDCSLGEAATAARRLLGGNEQTAPARWHCIPLVDRANTPPRANDPMAGIALFPGGEARRMPLQRPGSDRFRLAAVRRRNLNAILASLQTDQTKAAAAIGQVGQLIADLDADSAADVLYRLAEQYVRAGHWSLAAATFEALAEQYPQHPLCEPALRWLVAYYASGEVAWHMQTQRPSGLEETPAVAVRITPQVDRTEQAAYWAKQLERTWPQAFADPRVRFPLAVADRQRGFPRQAERYFLTWRYQTDHDAWWACAAAEQWLGDRSAPGPKPLARCVRADQVPHLDAVLDDAVWQRAGAMQLGGAGSNTPPAKVMLARDARFLYLAVEAQKAPGTSYSVRREPRQHDSDLGNNDRLELCLDVDRDYVTYYRLVVDYCGRPADDCWGNSTWNPRWFIAAEQNHDQWIVEAAIPFDQLVPQPPAPGTVWALGVQRVVPAVGFQSWNKPASPRIVPQGFGLLMFE